MADVLMASGASGPIPVDERVTESPIGEVLRDIARGGIAGALVGLVVGGLGGRLLMRLAAILQGDAAGAFTQNGNRIGDITLFGTLGLFVAGLFFGVLAGTVWVIVSPWIPGGPRTRALLTAGIAMSVGTPELIDGRNPDFVILDHDPVVVALLIALVGLMGLSIALLDGWLDRRLPHALSGHRMPATLYAIVALLGALLVLPFVLLIFLASDSYGAPLRAGYALIVVGLCTATLWALRMRGRSSAPRALLLTGRAALLVAVALGLVTEAPHILRAMGLRI